MVSERLCRPFYPGDIARRTFRALTAMSWLSFWRTYHPAFTCLFRVSFMGFDKPDCPFSSACNGRVWIEFKSKPSAEIRQALKDFGFRWSKRRGQWSHNCGRPTKPGRGYKPWDKYPTISMDEALAVA